MVTGMKKNTGLLRSDITGDLHLLSGYYLINMSFCVLFYVPELLLLISFSL